MKSSNLISRLAPSPTGRLHLGHAHTFVLAWLDARSRGGRILLRLEDLDRSRCRPEYSEGIVEDLRWLGLDWDGPIVYQHERLTELSQATDDLVQRGLAYPCVCRRAEVETALGAPHAGGGEELYPGTCRGRFRSVAEAKELTGRAPLVRLRVGAGRLQFVDRIAGAFEVDVSSEVGDYVISNRAQVPGYQLAVVVDDAAQGITEVFRGNDLLSSTGRQILLYDALGLAVPRWAHAPLVVNSNGRRLAKRSDDLSLARLREQGVDPRTIVEWVLQSTHSSSRWANSPHELLAGFSLRAMRTEPVPAPSAALLLEATSTRKEP